MISRIHVWLGSAVRIPLCTLLPASADFSLWMWIRRSEFDPLSPTCARGFPGRGRGRGAEMSQENEQRGWNIKRRNVTESYGEIIAEA